jgi:hypothetical protein
VKQREPRGERGNKGEMREGGEKVVEARGGKVEEAGR